MAIQQKRSPWPRRLVWIALIGAVLFWLGRSDLASEPTIEPGSVLVLPIAGSYVEASETPIVERLLGDQSASMAGLLGQFAMLERDDRIATVVLRIQATGVGWGKAQEIRHAIGRIREAGRHTIAVLEMEGITAMREYFIASAADEVYVSPGSLVPIIGLAAEYMHFGASFEKLGVSFEAPRVGRYKSAVEVFARSEMSDDAREMANALVDSIEAQWVAGVSESRGLQPDAVRAVIDAGPLRGAELASHGLVEGTRALAQVLDDFEHVVKAHDYARVEPASVGFEPVATYALIYGSGMVVQGKAGAGSGPSFAADDAVKALAEAAKDEAISAVILRIDSPGGSALASEIIWRAVEGVKATGKPVVASYSDVAASGGYYASAGADTIVSTGAALTGSIGVYMLRPSLEGLLDKLEVGVEPITRGKHAAIAIASRPLPEESFARLQAAVTATYDLFVTRVSDGRELSKQQVDGIGQGRVWTGEQAKAVGLVDEIGGLREAVLAAKRLAGHDSDADIALMPYPAPQPLAQQIADLLQLRAGSLAALDPVVRLRKEALLRLPGPLAQVASWLTDLPLEAPLTVSPLAISIR